MVLILEDRPEEKLGEFENVMQASGIKYVIAGTLEDANRIYKDNFKDIDTVILDYAIPKSKDDKTEFDSDTNPNGIRFLLDNEFKMIQRMTAIIINSSSEDDYKAKYFNRTNYSRHKNLVLFANRGRSSLAEENADSMLEIAKTIKEHSQSIEKASKNPYDIAEKARRLKERNSHYYSPDDDPYGFNNRGD